MSFFEQRRYLTLSLFMAFGVCLSTSKAEDTNRAADNVDYRQIAPILQKYCVGCHNANDHAGDFALDSLAALRKGTPDGPVIANGDPGASKLLQLLTGEGDSKMPPEDEPQPTAEDIQLLRTWVEQGAVGNSASMSLNTKLRVPKLQAAAQSAQYVGAACLVEDQLLAVGRLGTVELRDLSNGQTRWTNEDLPGKVNSIRLSPNGAWLIVGGGVAGLGGEVTVVDVEKGTIVKRLNAHNDTIYCASISPDGKWIASGSYDKNVILWNAESGAQVRQFPGHNGAIYDLDFDPSSQVLVTASADQTLKLWNIHDGRRLDTFGQPEGEMRCVRFSRDGKFVFAGGADRQIRKWRIVSKTDPAINPLLVARFAHESEVLQLQLLGDDRLLSASRDKTIKLWSTSELEPQGEIGEAQDQPVSICVSNASAIRIVDLVGNIETIPLDSLPASRNVAEPTTAVANEVSLPMTENAAVGSFTGEEPNDTLAQAIPIDLPAEIEGVITPSGPAVREDIDLYSFQAEAGQEWIFEVNAARDGSKLDSRIDILDEAGKGVLRTRLQAVRESYFTFRGKDGDTIDDFRMHKWEDMELDEFLYSSGEVVRLWLYPRGPDSGFKVYPGAGKRTTFFDTTAVAHALGEPAYIVRELETEEESLPNGLPVFPMYYENDDDALRRFGIDSRLTFVAPTTGKYFLRVRDSRGFGGPDYPYRLSIRPPNPEFTVDVNGESMNISIGTGREWSVTATRIDGLDGAISVALSGLPEGLEATNPLVIEAGQNTAIGTIYATKEAPSLVADQAGDKSEAQPPASENESSQTPKTYDVSLVASSQVHGRTITHELPQKLTITVSPAAGIRFELVDSKDASKTLNELPIRPGETITARILLERGGDTGAISFGKEDSGRGLPHGAFVDNIGLNGLLIPAEQTEREFFITAAPKVAPGRYQFHLRIESGGKPTSRPIWLNVLPREP